MRAENCAENCAANCAAAYGPICIWMLMALFAPHAPHTEQPAMHAAAIGCSQSTGISGGMPSGTGENESAPWTMAERP